MAPLRAIPNVIDLDPRRSAAYPRIWGNWIDCRPIKQKLIATPLPQAYDLRIRNGRVVVKGGDDSGIVVPLCCAEIKVTLTYEWNGQKLRLIDDRRQPQRS